MIDLKRLCSAAHNVLETLGNVL